jgi:RNA polymerase sigma-70 factor, ECF subfamily
VVQSVAGLVRDRDRAEEITSRAFERAWAKRNAFRGEASPYTWVQSIARNAAQESRVQDRIAEFDSIDQPEARQIPAPELLTDALEKEHERHWLQKALAQLPAKQRRALIAHFIDGLSIRDIARRERVPSGTILSRIHKGKQLLREAWEAPLRVPHADVTVPKTPSSKPKEGQSPQAPEPQGDKQPKTESPEPATWDR